MLSLQVEKRSEMDVENLRKQGILPGIVYGPARETEQISVSAKEFDAIYKKAGESSLIMLKMGKDEVPVLIYDIQREGVSGDIIHMDLYQPRLDKEIEITVPLVFIGEAPAVKELGGTMNRNIQEVEVSALPKDLPHEITVDVSSLKTFEDKITIEDLVVAGNVRILRDKEDIVAQALPVEDMEEELAAAPTENVADIEKIEKPKKEEEETKE